jgi:hypothetical protein
MLVGIHSPFESNGANASCGRHPRALFSVPLTLHHLGPEGVRIMKGIGLDIGEGGLGALTEGAVLVSETVAIDLKLSNHPLNAVAIVRATAPTFAAGSNLSG